MYPVIENSLFGDDEDRKRQVAALIFVSLGGVFTIEQPCCLVGVTNPRKPWNRNRKPEHYGTLRNTTEHPSKVIIFFTFFARSSSFLTSQSYTSLKCKVAHFLWRKAFWGLSAFATMSWPMSVRSNHPLLAGVPNGNIGRQAVTNWEDLLPVPSCVFITYTYL